jgi:predicted methyltransferase
MFKKIFCLVSTALISMSLSGCSEDISKMPVNKQSLYQPNRYSEDKTNDKNRHPEAILDLSGVKAGTKVLDLLGGGGYYSELFNYIVGDTGKVYIQNNSLFLRFSKKELDKRLNNNRLKNVVRLDSEFADMKLPKDIDLIFIGLSYHDIYVPRDDPTIMTSREEFFPQILAALKPGGKLLITDHAAKIGTGNSLSPSLHRIDEEWAIKDIESAGFKLIKTSDVLRNPKDDRTLDIWKKKFYHKTDRFVHLYEKITTEKK